MTARHCTLYLAINSKGHAAAEKGLRNLLLGRSLDFASQPVVEECVDLATLVVDLGEFSEARFEEEFERRLGEALLGAINELKPKRLWSSLTQRNDPRCNDSLVEGNLIAETNGLDHGRTCEQPEKVGQDESPVKLDLVVSPASINSLALNSELPAQLSDRMPNASNFDTAATDLRTHPAKTIGSILKGSELSTANLPWNNGKASDWLRHAIERTPAGWCDLAQTLLRQRSQRRLFAATFGLFAVDLVLEKAAAELGPLTASGLPSRPSFGKRGERTEGVQTPQRRTLLRGHVKKLRTLEPASSGVTQNPPDAPRRSWADIAFPLTVEGAGVVLIWPLLPKLMTRLGLIDRGVFVSGLARLAAADSISRLIEPNDHRAALPMVVPALLTGLDLNFRQDRMAIDDDRAAALDDLVMSAIAMIEPLRRLTPNDIRLMFLRRSGRLTRESDRFRLIVEEDATDVLLRGLPWPFDSFSLPWLDVPLGVSWRLL